MPKFWGEKELIEAAANENAGWLASLGHTFDQRVQSINAIYDAKVATISATFFQEYRTSRTIGPAGYLFFRVSRSLAAMDNREREYLRVTELLNCGNDGKYPLAVWWKAALLLADGRGTIGPGFNWRPVGRVQEVRARNESVIGNVVIRNPDARFNEEMRMKYSVDQTISEIHQDIERVYAMPNINPTYRALLDDIRGRIAPSGGGAWLAPAQVRGTVFEPASPFAVRIGSFPDRTGLTYSGDGSIVTIAPPGSGKTSCHVYPNLLTWAGPAIVLDVSGEIYEHTSGWRAAKVGPVFKFNPLDPENSHKYNPLTFVRSEPDYIWEDSRLLAELMIVPAMSSDPFWENEARTVLTAAIAYVTYSNPPESRPMHELLDVLFGGQPWDDMIFGLKMATDVRVMVQHATSLASMNEKTLSSVLQTARSSLSAWTGERVARATARSDWSPLDLRDGSNTTIYICVRPSEVEAYLSLLRVFIGQHIRVLTGGVVPPRDASPILLMLDELPRLRYMAPIDEALNIGRKYGLRLWMFAQSVGQLQAAYENADGMVGSCAVRIYMNPSGADGLAEKLSEELGYVDSLHDNSRRRLVEAADLAGPTYKDQQIVIGLGAKPAVINKEFAFHNAVLDQRMRTPSV
jgi:type IV secretion system protein VirD4